VQSLPHRNDGPSANDEAAFIETERQVLIRRLRLFSPISFTLMALSELAAYLTPEFPHAWLLTGIMLSATAIMFGITFVQPTRALIGWATVGMGVIAAGYIGTAAAETGRFHSQQILGMAVLIAIVPGLLSLSAVETPAIFVGSIVAYGIATRYWKPDASVDWAGAATGITYLSFLATVTGVSVSSNRKLRKREFFARREVERVHRFAVEEVLHRHLPPRYVEGVLSGEHPLDSPPERRTITVIFADIVSFTPLSEALKPEELAALMARFYDVTAHVAFEHGATIDKFIGDAVMAILGAPEIMPVADQARRAVAVAQAWHKAVRDLDGRRLNLRIGIHQDTVAVGLFGGKLRSDYTVLGMGVNVAARLEQRCRPGEIVVSDAIMRHLDPARLDTRDLGELELKGVPTPVHVHCIIPEGAPRRASQRMAVVKEDEG
jgi:class 3 adenylate cyclase